MEEFKTSTLDRNNKIVCKQCGVGYDNLPKHLVIHGYTQAEYKERYNLNPKEVLYSPRLRRTRKRIAKNNSKTNRINLVEKGQATRFKIGNKFTPVEKLRQINSKRMTKVWIHKREQERLQRKKRVLCYENAETIMQLEAIKLPMSKTDLEHKIYLHLKENDVLNTSNAELMEVARRSVREGFKNST